MLDQLVQERAADFRAVSRVGAPAPANVTTEPHDCYVRTFLVLRFVSRHISFPHAKAAKLAYRVFCQASSLQVSVGGVAVVDQVCQLLDSANSQIQLRIRRKLQSVAGDYPGSLSAQSSVDTVVSSDNATADPVVFFVSAQPAPQLESVGDAPSNAVSEHTPLSLVSNTKALARTDEEVGHAIEAGLAAENSVAYEAAVVVNKQATMIDACVQTSLALLRRNWLAKAASSFDDNSDVELICSGHVTEVSESAALPDSQGSTSGSRGSTCGTTDDFTDFSGTPENVVVEKVSFKKEVALSLNDSLDDSRGMRYCEMLYQFNMEFNLRILHNYLCKCICFPIHFHYNSPVPNCYCVVLRTQDDMLLKENCTSTTLTFSTLSVKNSCS